MMIDFTAIEAQERYKIMSNLIIPRPIAWIVTEKEYINIAPFSYFTGVSSNPPTVMVAIGHKSDGSEKDTLKLIRETKKCTICSVHSDHLAKMDNSAESLTYGLSEAEHCDIETEKPLENFPPMIYNTNSALFCTLLQEAELEGSKTVPLFLKIEYTYIKEGVELKTFSDEDIIGRTGKHYASLNTIENV